MSSALEPACEKIFNDQENSNAAKNSAPETAKISDLNTGKNKNGYIHIGSNYMGGTVPFSEEKNAPSQQNKKSDGSSLQYPIFEEGKNKEKLKNYNPQHNQNVKIPGASTIARNEKIINEQRKVIEQQQKLIEQQQQIFKQNQKQKQQQIQAEQKEKQKQNNPPPQVNRPITCPANQYGGVFPQQTPMYRLGQNPPMRPAYIAQPVVYPVNRGPQPYMIQKTTKTEECAIF